MRAVGDERLSAGSLQEEGPVARGKRLPIETETT